MPTIVEDCPRCGANQMTFDIYADVWVGVRYNWQHIFEVCVVCRRCEQPSLLRLELRDINHKENFVKTGTVMAASGDLVPRFRSTGFLNLADLKAQAGPDNLPEKIEAAFNEGAKCLAISCPNAAGTMFRLCLDLATKGLLPALESEGGPEKHQRRNLAPRLQWLFDHGILPIELKELSLAVKENGDDGAHDGDLTEDDAIDIFEFAHALLDRRFSQPARLASARMRREERRAAKPAAN